MSPELAAALLGAFVGAIGGGAASLAGSVIVNRMQLRREMRIRIYDDLLPKLLRNFARTASEIYSHLPYRTPEDFQTTMQEIERASVLAGRAEVKMATYLQYMITLRTLKGHSGTAASVCRRRPGSCTATSLMACTSGLAGTSRLPACSSV